jgi:molybdopterin/thiamine biosynthesis adenylyltransferase
MLAVLQVIVLGHELEAVLHSGRSCGTGAAHLLDTIDGMPEVVHLSLLESSHLPRPGTTIEIDWHTDHDATQPCPAGATGTGGSVWIDAAASPIQVRCALALSSGPRLESDAEIVRTGGQAFTRNLPVLETDALAMTTVLCVGLGSGGSAVVDLLARAGVGRFLLWDMDRLEAHNVGRHVCTLRDLGRRKAFALRDHVQAINPIAEVECYHADVLKSAADLDRAVEAADCVVVGTDNNASRFAVNEAAWAYGKPALFGRAFTRAAGGDVIQVIPPVTPCYCCHVAGRVVAEEVSSPRDVARVAYADRPVPVQPGLSMDIQPVANMLARLCVLRLCERLDSPLKTTAAEMTAPLYLWANRREEQFAAWRPMERSFDRLSVLRWYAITVRRDKECPVCSHG